MTHPLGEPSFTNSVPALAPSTAPAEPGNFNTIPGFWKPQAVAQKSHCLSWLWHGYIASGNVTLFTSQWKSGKTTLASVLLARMASGGELAGLAVKPARAIVISEESHMNWQQRNQRLHFGKNVTFLCRPFTGKPTLEQWSTLIQAMLEAHAREGLDLVMIDPLVNFLPGYQENSADGLMQVLLILQQLTALGIAVLILHHPRKGQVRAGQAARGSGALGGFADILLEMRWYGQPTDDDHRRVIEGYSRHEETPRRLVVELTEDRNDYVSHGDLVEDEFASTWETLRPIFERASGPLTRGELRQRWPRGRTRPNDATIWRWLERLVGDGLVVQEGKGRKNDPFRYQVVE